MNVLKKINKLLFDNSSKIIKLHYKSKKNIIYKKIYENKIYTKYNCCISSKSYIDKNLFLPHPIGIVIGEGVRIGKNVTIYQNVTLGRKYKEKPEYPIIGNNVTIYCNSAIIGNVKIGDNAVIGCNSVVLRNVKDGEIVSGIVK